MNPLRVTAGGLVALDALVVPAMSERTIVVGAGPVGLTAALALRSLDVPVTVVEAGAADRVRPGSRAIFIHGASMQLLEDIRPGLGRSSPSTG